MKTLYKARLSILGATVVFAVVLMFGCAPEASSDKGAASSDADPGIQVAWSEDADCATCHTDRGGAVEKEHETQGHSCLSCHEDAAGLAEVHEQASAEGATSVNRLRHTELASSVCLSCHDEGELAEATAESSLLTDTKGTTVNPHELPEGHLDDKLECYDCHSVHEDSDVTQDAKESCLSCHHEEVYECNTCH